MNITREELVAVLNQDDYYRNKREWPLINVNNYKRIRVKKCEVFYIGIFNDYDDYLQRIDDINNKFTRFYPNTPELLNKFGNNLIAAGGSICRLLNNCKVTSDVDFFFYDLDIENANKLRIEIIKWLIKTWRSQIGTNISRNHINNITLNDVKFYINRNEFTTTIHVEEYTNYMDYPFVHMYQFIHRIYPNKSSIIGGFDISASMLLYDGKNIYTTPLGLWSQTRRSIIVDMSRRSTSYEYRLQKYAGEGLNFNIIFPGLSKDLLFDTVKFNIELSDLLKKYSLKIIDDDEIVTFDNSKNLKYLDLSHTITNITPERKNGLMLGYKNYDLRNNYDEDINTGRRSNFNIYLDQLSDYANDDKFMLNNCDYGNNGMFYKCVPLANATRLGLSNLASVVSTISIHFSDENYIDGILKKEIHTPNLGITNKVLKWYTERFYKLINSEKSDIYHRYNTSEIIKILGKDYSKTFYSNYQQINNVFESLIINIKHNTEICRENLIGIKWITENPGRQWTSSINPIFSDPRDWYGEHYIPVLVGIPPEIETCLRLARIRSIWAILNDDVFNQILFHIYENYANKAWDYI